MDPVRDVWLALVCVPLLELLIPFKWVCGKLLQFPERERGKREGGRGERERGREESS